MKDDTKPILLKYDALLLLVCFPAVFQKMDLPLAFLNTDYENILSLFYLQTELSFFVRLIKLEK